jgi:hypothetical protein
MSDPRDAEAREIVEPFLNRALVLSAPNSETAVRVLGIAAKQARVRAVAALARRDDALARAVAAERERCALQLQYAPPEAFARDYAAILRATPAGAEGGVV